MLHTVTGDILLSKAQAIAHGVGPEDHFTQGLALGLREQWPAMSRDFRHWCHQTNPKPGSAWMWGGVGNQRIFCLVTQDASKNHDHPGRATIENVNHCLRELSHRVEKEKITSLAIPRLATGVGGLEWAEVEKQIEHHLGALKIPVYVYATYKKGVVAEETGLPPAQKFAR
jgi:O-acetyl-ADP-ribose deacetylase (regulator of RNase III)